MLQSAGLTGRSDNKVDTKGRLNIPAAMRKILAPDDRDEVIVLLVPTGHLLLFNKEYWGSTIQQSIFDRAKTKGEQNAWRAINRLSENSHTTPVDSQGRITIPGRLLKKAEIKDQAVVIGAFDRVFVWEPGKYESWIQEEDVDSAIAESGMF